MLDYQKDLEEQKYNTNLQNHVEPWYVQADSPSGSLVLIFKLPRLKVEKNSAQKSSIALL